jgi:excisionase family DNA binding protein
MDYTAPVSRAEGSQVDNSSALTVREVAGYLNVDEKTIYRLAKRGDLPGFKVAGIWRFKKGDIDQWIEQQKLAAAPEKMQTKDTGR